MFRIGGSAGTGITSGLDQPQEMANGGRTGYNQGSMPIFNQQVYLVLQHLWFKFLSHHHSNIFQTGACKEPFKDYRQQTEAMKTASDRAFAEN